MQFLHVRFCSVSVRKTELLLTFSVWFGQNSKTLLRSVTNVSTSMIFPFSNFLFSCLVCHECWKEKSLLCENFEKVYLNIKRRKKHNVCAHNMICLVWRQFLTLNELNWIVCRNMYDPTKLRHIFFENKLFIMNEFENHIRIKSCTGTSDSLWDIPDQQFFRIRRHSNKKPMVFGILSSGNLGMIKHFSFSLLHTAWR